MNMSSQLEFDGNMNLIRQQKPPRKMYDSDSVVSEIFRDIDLSRIDSASQQSTQSNVADDELSDDGEDANDGKDGRTTAVSPPSSIHIAPQQQSEYEQRTEHQNEDTNIDVESAVKPVIERSENLEEDEKAMELDNEEVVLPTMQRQQRIFSQTVAEENENETVIQ